MRILSRMVLVCALMGTVLPAFGSTYYVSTAGNDQANGSAATPWKTLQHAANSVIAGDTVIVRPGAYAGFVLGWDGGQNGTASQPITFQADPGAVINSRNNKTADGINLEGASYIRIEGFTIQNGDGSITRAGIRSVTNTNVIIRGNTVDGMGTWGIFTGFSDNILIEDNETSRSASQHGIYFSNSADNPVIRGNRSWGNSGCGIHMNGDLSQGGDGIISGAVVEANIIHDNGKGGGSGINCDGVQNSVIRNNLLYNNHASGISLYDIDGAAGSKNNAVINNTIIEASDARWAINIKDGSTGNTVLNNILFNNNSGHGSINIAADSLSGFTSDYNIVENRFSPNDGSSTLTLSQWQTQTGQDKHSILATQASVFVNGGANDYRLSATSPAVDKGTSGLAFGVTADITGNSRPKGTGWDIGAYEYPSVAGRFTPVDFDGDRRTDIAVYREGTGGWFILPSSTGQSGVYGIGFGGDSSDLPVPGNYDWDGKTDVALYRKSTGAWFIYPSSTGPSGIYGVGFGGDASDIPVPGDYDGDAKTDLAIYRKNTGAWFIYPSSTGPSGIYGVGFGGDPSDIPVPGDYDGDGKTDLAIYRKSTGAWFIYPSSIGQAGVYGVGFGGDPSDIPVPGDYDGDGKTDLAIYRKNAGAWFIYPSSAGASGIYSVGFGGDASDIPVPGDYDGDGKTDIAVYRKSTGAWYIVPSSGASVYGIGWGGDPTDIPVTTNLPSND